MTEKETIKEYELLKKDYMKALEDLNKFAKLRCIDKLEKELMSLHTLRVSISTLECVLDIPYEEIFLPV